ncbi:MAG TPA: 30S ribosomal protein S13 [Planctomycetota bacterium]|jgi:small subunit ribosomal protein S13|nr:30S ribosomal protein S13 [Planctomycetota bacterium]
MPRLLGVDIPSEKRIEIALQYIYGVGPTVSRKVLKELAINPGVRAKDLKDDEVANIASYLEKNFVVEGALRRVTMQNINRLKEIYCYRGLRHRRGLPVRGQRTRSNARGRKGPRKTVANKKILRK